MGKHWARQQVKQNELGDVLAQAAAWVEANRQTAAVAAGGALLAALVGGLIFYRSHSRQNSAWDRLSMAEIEAYTGQPEQSLQHVKDLTAEFAGTRASSFGELFWGDLLFPRGQYKEALEAYSRIVERGQPKALVPVALSDTVISQEAAGDPKAAAQSAQRFLEAYPDHFLAPQVHASLARCLQAQGLTEQAKAALQKIVLQYPDTSWAAWAQKRLQGK